MVTSKKSSSENKNGKGKQSGSSRRSPGSSGRGEYYHIELRPDEDFATYRTQDVGDPGHIQRVAGKREGGGWSTVKWLVAKGDAHVEGGRLIGDTSEAKDLLKKLRSSVTHKSGDRFAAKVRTRSAAASGQKKSGNKSSGKTQTTKSKSKGKSR